jgi:hypothetical protein
MVPRVTAGATAVELLLATIGAALAVVAVKPTAVASVAAVMAVPARTRKWGIFIVFLPLGGCNDRRYLTGTNFDKHAEAVNLGSLYQLCDRN